MSLRAAVAESTQAALCSSETDLMSLIWRDDFTHSALMVLFGSSSTDPEFLKLRDLLVLAGVPFVTAVAADVPNFTRRYLLPFDESSLMVFAHGQPVHFKFAPGKTGWFLPAHSVADEGISRLRSLLDGCDARIRGETKVVMLDRSWIAEEKPFVQTI
jgi:hypothetical protein